MVTESRFRSFSNVISLDHVFSQPSKFKRKAGRPYLGWEDVLNKDLKEMGTSWEGVKREALNRLGWRRSVRDCVGLRRLGAVVSYYQ